jgi:TetR/AcrR family transcriptional repressor of nem operon
MPWEKNFDVETALDKAGEAFWTQGYDATSMADLLDAMGIQKGSFYATYGSKREVYDRALAKYVGRSSAWVAGLTEGKSPKQAIQAIVEATFADCSGPDGHRGCMVINCAIELGHSDPDAQTVVKRSFGVFEKIFKKLVREGQASGDFSAELDPNTTAKALMGMVMGMRVYSRSGASRATLKALADQMMLMVHP